MKEFKGWEESPPWRFIRLRPTFCHWWLRSGKQVAKKGLVHISADMLCWGPSLLNTQMNTAYFCYIWRIGPEKKTLCILIRDANRQRPHTHMNKCTPCTRKRSEADWEELPIISSCIAMSKQHLGTEHQLLANRPKLICAEFCLGQRFFSCKLDRRKVI